jgi:hypothetical protein
VLEQLLDAWTELAIPGDDCVVAVEEDVHGLGLMGVTGPL